MADKIELDVVTPERRVLSREVDAVVLPGELGYFGVLPGHAPLLSRLTVGELSFDAGESTTRMAICGGYVEVLGHRVRVLADTCELDHEIDADRAKRSRKRAEAELARKDLSGREFDLAEFRLKKAVMRIQVHGRRAS